VEQSGHGSGQSHFVPSAWWSTIHPALHQRSGGSPSCNRPCSCPGIWMTKDGPWSRPRRPRRSSRWRAGFRTINSYIRIVFFSAA
jgi:hypothetical protein